MLTFFKLLKGYLLIKVTGYSPERFMNLCSNKEILLWDIKKDDEGYNMYISLKAFKQIRPLTKKTGTKVVILKRFGLPFFIGNLKKRTFFLIGLCLAFLFWYVSANFIWAIEFNGNYTISDDEFFRYLEEQEIKVGIMKNTIDVEDLEKGIREEFDIVTWTSAKITGTKLNISVKENEIPNTDTTNEATEYGHLLADFDGIIHSMIVRSGQINAQIGQEVKKGDILVNGCVPVYAEDQTIKNYQCYMADADIYIEHHGTFQKKLPINYTQKYYTGRENTSSFYEIGNKVVSLALKPPYISYDVLSQTKQIVLLENLYLPIFQGKTTYREFYNIEKAYTKEEAHDILLSYAEEFWQTLMQKGVQIVQKNVTIENDGMNYILIADYTVIEKTSTIQKFNQTEIPQIHE